MHDDLRIARALRDVSVKQDVLTKPYYNCLRFMINVAGSSGEIPLVDGGALD